MVVRIDPEEQSASILSFPRDLWIPIADTGEPARINSAHARGEQVLIDTIRQNFGVPINHYVEVDFVGFEQLVDAVGGVPMWFDAPVRDRNSGLSIEQAECQVLDGEQARQFVRARHLQYMDEDGDWVSDGTADLGRITRQQAFIRRAVHKAVSKGLGNPMTLNELVSAGVANVRLDGAFSTGDILSLGKQFAEYDADDLVGYSIPSEGSRTSSGAAVQLPLMADAEEILNVFRGLPPGTVSPQSIEVTVLNGSGVEGQARDVAGALGSIGFNVQGIGTSPEHLTRTTVRYGEGAEAEARMLGRYITGGAALVPDEDVAEGEVVLVTGTDFTTVHDQPAPEGSARRRSHDDVDHRHDRGRAGCEHHVLHDDHDGGRLCHRRTPRRRGLRLIVTITAAAMPARSAPSRAATSTPTACAGSVTRSTSSTHRGSTPPSRASMSWTGSTSMTGSSTTSWRRADSSSSRAPISSASPTSFCHPSTDCRSDSYRACRCRRAIWTSSSARPCPSICVARWIYELCIEGGVPEHLLTHIPDGIDPRRFQLTRPIEDRRPQVSMLYHRSPIKGAAEGLAALELVHEAVPEAAIVLFGRETPERRLPEWVTYHEHPPQRVLIEEVYNGARVFMCSSRWGEGFGKTPLEAMACGAALVTTDNGGSRDFAHDGVTALVSDPGDPVALSANVLRLLRDDELRIGLATRGHRLASGFTWDRSVRAVAALLEDYMEDARPIDLPDREG